MRLFRLALIVVLFVVLGIAIYQSLLWLGVWGNLNDSQVKELQDGDQEIALIEPATSIDDWGRIVTAIEQLEKDWPKINPALPALTVSMKDAFPPLSAEVPEIVFTLGRGRGPKLRLRWYKISGEHDAASWVNKLHARGREPLAIIGGGTSDRAIKLAYALRKAYDQPALPAPVVSSDPRSPVFLITTATAEETKSKKLLIGVYKDRSFRFSFTNRKMVASLLQFVQYRQFPDDAKQWGAGNLWAHEPAEGQMMAHAGAGFLSGLPAVQPYAMHAVAWQDERYSLDMFDLFKKEFKQRFPLGEFDDAGSVPGSIGGFYQPAPAEQFVVGTFLARPTPVAPNSFLVLPTSTVRMRRFLINLQRRSPAAARNLVILNGDAIALNAIYRDRDVAWNILDLPYSLVFFAHRNPIDHAAGFPIVNKDGQIARPAGADKITTTGTNDILLYRDVFEAFLYAAFDNGTLLNDPARVRDRLKATCWHQPAAGATDKEAPRVCNPQVHSLEGKQQPFFDAAGDRQSHTGEHIVWLKPFFTDQGVDLKSMISVWAVRTGAGLGHWELAEAFPAFYNQSRLEGPQP